MITDSSELVSGGMNIVCNSSVIFCGIVKDCAKPLTRNIKIIEKLCDYFKDSLIVIYENDSVDDTKLILQEWSVRNKKVKVISENWNEVYKNQKMNETLFFKANSLERISNMARCRNKYLDYITYNQLKSDYIIVVDLDVASININGVLDTFDDLRRWDAVSANGIALSAKLRNRYFDTYALCEIGEEKLSVTDTKLQTQQFKWGKFKSGMPWVPVFSAFGGLCIYRYQSIINSRYRVVMNEDSYIQTKCEHFGLFEDMNEKGYDKVFLNPTMVVKYRSATVKDILVFLQRFYNRMKKKIK